jgi:type IV pilus assembly protein PilM
MNLKREIKLSDLVRRSGSVKKTGPSKALGGEVVGLKIGASQLAASRVANNGSARLLQLARCPLPSGIVVSGEVRDIPALAAALNEFFRVHKLPRRGVRLGVATNRIGVRSFELAGIDDEHQLENAIRFRAHDALSIPVDDAVLDYHVVSKTLDDSGQTVRRVVLAAAYRDSIDRYVAAGKQAGIEVVAVDLEAFALLRTVAPALASDAPAAVVAVTIGHDRTTLAISDGTVCDFTRVLEWGGASLDEAIERELGIRASEATELKRALSLETAATPGAEADERKSARAREAVRRELQSLARDLVNSLQFYQAQPGSLAISEVLLAGGTSRLNGLPEELERLTHVRVRRADPLARVQVAESVGSREDLPSLAVAIGLGIEV